MISFKKYAYCALLGIVLAPAVSLAESSYKNSINLTSESQESNVTITKKPTIICSAKDIDYKNITAVLIDDTDVTDSVEIKDSSIVFRAFMPLSSGEHTFSVIYKENGENLRKDFSFATKQSKYFDTATTKLSATTVYTNTLKKSSKLADIPYHKVESNPTANVLLENEHLKYSFDASLRYFNQSLPIQKPQKKGIDLASYLMSAVYKNEDFSAGVDIGDIQIDESDYSAQGLSSRGAKSTISYKSYTVNGFVMDSKQRYGFKGGTGMDIGSHNSIYGISLAKSFFEDTNLKFLYIHGKKEGDGFGTASSDSQTIIKEGKVYAVVLSSPIIRDKLSFESEIDFSSYDSDISDSFGNVHDKAYNIKLHATPSEVYQLNAKYEYIGRQYYSLGNEGLTNDIQGIYFNGSANYQYHTFTLNLSRSNNNVDNVPLYSKVYTYSGELDYSLSRFEHVPVNLSYRRDYIKSTKEPTADDKQKLITDTYHGDIGYNMDEISTTFGIDYSKQNDKTKNNQDSSTTTYSLTPSYATDNFHIDPNLSFNRSKDYKAGLKTDTTTLGLAFGGNFLKQSLTYDFDGAYTITQDNGEADAKTNTRELSTSFQIAYVWASPKNWILKNPSVGIRGSYNHSKDKTSGTTDHDINVQLFVSVPLEYIF